MTTTDPKGQNTRVDKSVISLTIHDLSAFSKGLRHHGGFDLKQTEMLGLIAKAAGYRNYQHLRSQNEPQPSVDHKAVDRAARAFDHQGKLALWPAKRRCNRWCYGLFGHRCQHALT